MCIKDLEDARHEAESLRGILAELDAQNDEQELLEAHHEIEGLKSKIQDIQNKVCAPVSHSIMVLSLLCYSLAIESNGWCRIPQKKLQKLERSVKGSW